MLTERLPHGQGWLTDFVYNGMPTLFGIIKSHLQIPAHFSIPPPHTPFGTCKSTRSSPFTYFSYCQKTHVIFKSINFLRQGTSSCAVIKKPRGWRAYRMMTPESLLPHPLFILNRAHLIFENHLIPKSQLNSRKPACTAFRTAHPRGSIAYPSCR